VWNIRSKWKNRAKEYERKLRKAEDIVLSETNKPGMTQDEVYDKIESELKIPREYIPGILQLTAGLVERQTRDLKQEVGLYKYKSVKSEIKSTVSSNKPDFKDFESDIDKDIDSLDPEIKRNPKRLEIEVEKSYWAAKGKRADKVAQQAELRAKKKATEDKGIVSSQPEGARVPSNANRTVQFSDTEKSIIQNMIDSGMIKDEQEYINSREQMRKR